MWTRNSINITFSAEMVLFQEWPLYNRPCLKRKPMMQNRNEEFVTKQRKATQKQIRGVSGKAFGAIINPSKFTVLFGFLTCPDRGNY